MRLKLRSSTIHRSVLQLFAATLALFMIFPLTNSPCFAIEKKEQKTEERMLVPLGKPFGVRFYTKGVMVYKVKPESTAFKAGILAGDLIESVNGEAVEDGPAFLKKVTEQQGHSCKLGIRRKGKSIVIALPSFRAEEESLGIYLRDSLAGIGTFTFYDPQSGLFAALGHGICDSHSGTVLPLLRGTISDVRITSVNKGQIGAPGQLRGLFCPGNKGRILKNCETGIYGQPDDPALFKGEALPVASSNEIEEGVANILCSINEEEPCTYRVEIEEILSLDENGKNYLIHVTDPLLLEQTGGIVQGISGSPILQNGKIVGAVTHVLVDDPTRGYGIYIGNMLKNMPSN